jgi:hypothetical protein
MARKHRHKSVHGGAGQGWAALAEQLHGTWAAQHSSPIPGEQDNDDNDNGAPRRIRGRRTRTR